MNTQQKINGLKWAVHKENAGILSARNCAMKYIWGI